MVFALIAFNLVLLVAIAAWARGKLHKQAQLSQEKFDIFEQRLEALALPIERIADQVKAQQEFIRARANHVDQVAADPLLQLQAGMLNIVKRMAFEAADDETDPDEAQVTVPSPFSVLDHAVWVEAVQLWREHGAPLIQDAPDRDCPACRSSDHLKIFESYDGFPFHACQACGTWFVPKRVNGELFDRYFKSCPRGAEVAERIVRQRLTSGRENTDRTRISGYLQELVPLIDECGGAGRTLLDIGCGLGRSLQVAEEMGFRAHGIEADPAAVEIARENGLSVSLPGEAIPEKRYSLISLWETIEHLDDPREVLGGAVESLAEGGIVSLTFPNLNCPTVRFLRSDCVYVHGGVTTPGHINLFSLEAIEALLASLGLSVVDADAQYGSNLQELMLYSLGKHRGAIDYINGSDRTHSISKRAMELNSLVGPPLALAERILLLAPILQVYACRTEDKPRFAQRVRRAKQRRATEILAQADSMLPSSFPTPPLPTGAALDEQEARSYEEQRS